jgi:hypothetical protein
MTNTSTQTIVAASLRRAFGEIHRNLWWLEMYSDINDLIAEKLLSELKEQTSCDIVAFMSSLKMNSFWHSKNAVYKKRKQFYKAVADQYFKGNIVKARKEILQIE